MDCSTGQPRLGLGFWAIGTKSCFHHANIIRKLKCMTQAKNMNVTPRKHRHFPFIVHHMTKIQWRPLCNRPYLVGQDKVMSCNCLVTGTSRMRKCEDRKISSLPITQSNTRNDKLRKYQKDNAYLLFKDRHISDVRISDFIPVGSKQYLYTTAGCRPQTRQSAPPYSTWLLISNESSVQSGGCSCVAG